MTFDEFEKIRLKLNDLEEAIAYSKGKEYANSDDRLANFKRIAVTLDLSPLKVAYVYFKKHLDAIEYAVKGKVELSESFESRISDAILYLKLMYAIHREELEKEDNILPPTMFVKKEKILDEF